VLLVADQPYMADAMRDGLRLEAIAADIAGDGDTELELLSVNAYDIAVLDRDIPVPSGDEIANASWPPAATCRSSCSRPPIVSTTRPPVRARR
jgi:DNA-binding response OmpR family regulator